MREKTGTGRVSRGEQQILRTVTKQKY